MILWISWIGITSEIPIDENSVESYETDPVEVMSVTVIELDNGFTVSASIDPTTDQVRLDRTPLLTAVSIAGDHESNRIVLEGI